MATRYFRKRSPLINLFMSNGRHIKFAEMDKTWGYLTSDDRQIRNDEKILAEIDQGIADERGGVQEITASEYNELHTKKKAMSSSSPESTTHWREEITAGTDISTLGFKAAPQKAVAAPEQSAAVEQDSKANALSLRERVNLR